MLLPVYVLAITYIIVYTLQAEEHVFSLSNYIYFAYKPVLNTLSVILYLSIISIAIVCLYWLAVESDLFKRKDSGEPKKIITRKLKLIVVAIFIYFIFAAFDFLLSDIITDPVFMLLNTLVFVIGVIYILGLQHVVPDHEDLNTEIIKKTVLTQSEISLDQKVTIWMSSSSKLYLKENITLHFVAESLNVNPRLLSEYLNNMLGVNFNTWINSLRIEEVKSIINNKEEESLTEIAYKTGFSDLAAMSRIFKRLQGETPTAYRNRIHKE
ncbi:MAG: helix-turn-helix domain-containing protein [Bacteroidales bacterium]